MQDCTENAVNDAAHAAVVERRRRVAGRVVVQIAEEGRVGDDHRRPAMRPVVALIGSVGPLKLTARTIRAPAMPRFTCRASLRSLQPPATAMKSPFDGYINAKRPFGHVCFSV